MCEPFPRKQLHPYYRRVLRIPDRVVDADGLSRQAPFTAVSLLVDPRAWLIEQDPLALWNTLLGQHRVRHRLDGEELGNTPLHQERTGFAFANLYLDRTNVVRRHGVGR